MIIRTILVQAVVHCVKNAGNLSGVRQRASRSRCMLKEAVESPFSPSAFQASLQTSTFQADNQLIGIAVRITRKTDVKNHLSARLRTQNRTYLAANQQDVMRLATTAADQLNARLSAFSEDFLGEHSPRRTVVALPVASTGAQAAQISRSLQE